MTIEDEVNKLDIFSGSINPTLGKAIKAIGENLSPNELLTILLDLIRNGLVYAIQDSGKIFLYVRSSNDDDDDIDDDENLLSAERIEEIFSEYSDEELADFGF